MTTSVNQVLDRASKLRTKEGPSLIVETSYPNRAELRRNHRAVSPAQAQLRVFSRARRPKKYDAKKLCNHARCKQAQARARALKARTKG